MIRNIFLSVTKMFSIAVFLGISFIVTAEVNRLPDNTLENYARQIPAFLDGFYTDSLKDVEDFLESKKSSWDFMGTLQNSDDVDLFYLILKFDSSWAGPNVREVECVWIVDEFTYGKKSRYRILKFKEKKKKSPDNLVFVEGMTINEQVADSEVFIKERSVQIPNLYVSDHEVTQDEYDEYCNFKIWAIPYGIGENFPLYQASWYDALVYCNLRSIAEGFSPAYSIGGEKDPRKWPGITSKDNRYSSFSESQYKQLWDNVTCDFSANGYRLPTDAEWEYLARGGKKLESFKFSGSDVLDDVGWYSGNCDFFHCQKVKGKKPNSLGLYDMCGGVYEWVWDFYDDIEKNTPPTGPSSGWGRVMRGGCWSVDSEPRCKVSARSFNTPDSHGDSLGFRVVRTAK